jgi:hypothetical protein
LSIERLIVRRLADSLQAQAVAARAFLAGETDLATAADPIADRLGHDLRVRVTVIGADGKVWGDTDLDGEALRNVENHADRPEVKAAFLHGEGRSVRYSHTLGRDLLYVAVRLDPDDPSKGVVRLAVPLDEVRRARAAVRGPRGAWCGASNACRERRRGWRPATPGRASVPAGGTRWGTWSAPSTAWPISSTSGWRCSCASATRCAPCCRGWWKGCS